MKESEKIDKYRDLAGEQKKAVEYESDIEFKWSGWVWNVS